MSTADTALAATQIDALQRAARVGDAPAMADLGRRLLTGADIPFNLKEGVAWTVAAAERDEPRALCQLATLAAMGATAPPDWPAALAHLERAAIVGSVEARRQLRLLAGQAPATDPEAPAGAAERADWRGAASEVDLQTWRSAPSRTALWETPRVRLSERFVSGAVCDWLRRRAEGRMRPAKMYHTEMKEAVIDPHRTCSDYQFDVANTDLVVLLVRDRISALTKLPTIAMEPPRVFHYALGEEIQPHFDRCNDAVGGYGQDTGYLGDRIVTFLLYLNDGFDGGDLDFPRAGFRCRGAKGDGVYFSHVDAAGKADPLSLHAGLKITRGEKWVLSQWIHDRPFGVDERRSRSGGA